MYLLNHSLCPWVFDFKESKFKMGFWLHKWGQLRKEWMWEFLKVVLSKMGKNPEGAWCTPQEPIMNHCEFSEDRHICFCPSIQKVCFRRLHLKEVITRVLQILAQVCSVVSSYNGKGEAGYTMAFSTRETKDVHVSFWWQNPRSLPAWGEVSVGGHS